MRRFYDTGMDFEKMREEQIKNMNKGIRRLIIPGDGYVGMRDWKFKNNESTYYDYERDMQCTIDVGSIAEAERELDALAADV